MSDAKTVVQAAVVTALRERLGNAVSGIYHCPPVGAKLPYAAIAEGSTVDWSAKGMDGREHLVAVVLWDEAGRASRMHALMSGVEEAIEGLPRELGRHRVASIAFLKARLLREHKQLWAGLVQYRLRTVAVADPVLS